MPKVSSRRPGLNVAAASGLDHPRLHQAAQGREPGRQIPFGQGCRVRHRARTDGAAMAHSRALIFFPISGRYRIGSKTMSSRWQQRGCPATISPPLPITTASSWPRIHFSR